MQRAPRQNGRVGFRFEQWRVEPATNSIWKDDLRKQLEPRAMDVLVYLCGRHNEVVAAGDILAACWGTTFQGDNPVHKTLSHLRQAFGDSAVGSKYFETIRKRGYRAIGELRYEPAAAPIDCWRRESPYPGLEAFGLKHAPVFFGRELAVAGLDRTVRAQFAGGCALVVLLGPSGSGKSSLVQAGLLPRFMAEPPGGLPLAGSLTLDCADLAELDPFDALGSVLLDADADGNPVFDGESAATLGRRLAQEMPWVLERLCQRLPGTCLFLFIDRLETVFQLAHVGATLGAGFHAALEQLARSGRVLLVVACRNDFYPALMADPTFSAAKERGAHVDLGRPDATGIARMIRQPARAAGLRFEVDPESGAGLDELLCREAVQQPDLLPLLAYCLHELYRHRSVDGALTLGVFRELGGIDGAIGARAEQVVATLGPAELDALPAVLSRLVNVAEYPSAVTARQALWSALRPGPEQTLVRALTDARLFISDFVGGHATYGVAHEAVLRRWPRVVAWIDKHHQVLALRARVSAQADRWQLQDKAPDLLLPSGLQARQGASLLETPEFSLSSLEREFILASQRKARRLERLRVAVSVMLLGLSVIASALGLTAHVAQGQAERHRLEAEGLMAFMLGEFASQVRPLGRLDLLDSISARALVYLSDPGDSRTDQVALTQRATTLQLIAEVKIARADPAAATTALRAARDILQRQARSEPGNREVLARLGANAFWLGQIAFDQNDWEGAQAHFEEYRRVSDALSALAPADIDAWVEQSYAHNSLGSVALKRGDVAVAAREFARSVELKRRALARKSVDPTLVADLADSLSWLASTKQQLGELDAAMALYDAERTLLLPLHTAAPGDGLWTHRYAFALWHQAELQLALGRTAMARGALVAASGLLEGLVRQDAGNRAWQMDAANLRLQLLAIDAGAPDDTTAPARLDALHREFTALAAFEPKKTDLARLAAVSLADKAAWYLRHGRADAARAVLAPALVTLERLHGQGTSDPKVRDALVAARLLDAAIADRAGDRRGAVDTCRRVRDMLGPAAAGSADFRLLSAWVRVQYCMGEGARAAGQQRQLAAIGYRDSAYVQAISTTTMKGSK